MEKASVGKKEREVVFQGNGRVGSRPRIKRKENKGDGKKIFEIQAAKRPRARPKETGDDTI